MPHRNGEADGQDGRRAASRVSASLACHYDPTGQGPGNQHRLADLADRSGPALSSTPAALSTRASPQPFGPCHQQDGQAPATISASNRAIPPWIVPVLLGPAADSPFEHHRRCPQPRPATCFTPSRCSSRLTARPPNADGPSRGAERGQPPTGQRKTKPGGGTVSRVAERSNAPPRPCDRPGRTGTFWKSITAGRLVGELGGDAAKPNQSQPA